MLTKTERLSAYNICLGDKSCNEAPWFVMPMIT